MDYYEKKICDLTVSTLYLFNDQRHRGRCVVACRNHYDELFEMPHNEMLRFMEDVSLSSKTLKELYGAQKINYAIYGDIVSHVHFHIVPKYRDGYEWGGAFTDDGERLILSDEENKNMINEIKAAIINSRR